MPDELIRPDLLVAGNDRAARATLLDAVFDRRDDWDLLHLDELRFDQRVLDEFEARALARNLHYQTTDFDPCPYLEKRGRDWQAYLASRSKKFARNLSASRRRMERSGRVHYEFVSDNDGMEAALERFFAIENESWKAAAYVDVGQDSRYIPFYRDLTSGESRDLSGRAIIQSVDGEDSAATFGVINGKTYYALQIAHKQAFDRYSPGTLLEAREMQWFFANQDLHRYEFLSGAPANKRRWTDSAVRTCQIAIYKRRLKTELSVALEFRLVPLLHQWTDRRRNKQSPGVKPFDIR